MKVLIGKILSTAVLPDFTFAGWRKFYGRDTKFLSIRASPATVFFLEIYPCQFRPECPIAAASLRQNYKRKKSRKNSDANSTLHSTQIKVITIEMGIWYCVYLVITVSLMTVGA